MLSSQYGVITLTKSTKNGLLFHFHHSRSLKQNPLMAQSKRKALKSKKAKYFCGSCLKDLGKGSRKKPSIWCHICGWVHFECSGLKNTADYRKQKDFLCSKCSVSRRLVPCTNESMTYSKLHALYTSCKNPAAFGSRKHLKAISNCTYKDVDNYLNRSETYTKFKQTRNQFQRLKVQSYRLNEIWSIDLADMQKLSRFNNGTNYIFVAVDTLSRYVWALPLKNKTAIACKDALDNIIKNLNDQSPNMMKPKFCEKTSSVHKPEKIWVDKGREFAGDFAAYCRKQGIKLYSTNSETKSAFAERMIRSLKSILFKFLHEHNTDTYIADLQNFLNVINSRVNRMTKLAPKAVKKSDVPYLISLQCSNEVRKPKYAIGQQVRIKRKIDTFHRGYKIQFTEEVFTIVGVQTVNPPTYSIKDRENQLIQGKFYESELSSFTSEHETFD